MCSTSNAEATQTSASFWLDTHRGLTLASVLQAAGFVSRRFNTHWEKAMSMRIEDYALLGDARNGRWRLPERAGDPRVGRRYLDGSLVLETTPATASGTVTLTDWMVWGAAHPGTRDRRRSGTR